MDKATSNYSSSFEENLLKREKKRKLETKREIEKMRAELPKYNLNDIRQFKLPYHEALLLQLEESGYANTEEYIKYMFDFQEQLRISAGPHSNMWNRPILKHSDVELRKLSEALIKAEDYHNKRNYNAETEVLLITAIDFCFNTKDWFWLGEQVLMKGLKNAMAYQSTGKHESLARYIYAKLLIEKVMDYENAEMHLNISRKLSAGKSWNIKQFFPDLADSTTLFMNANYLLHLCYMRQARHWAKIDLKYAIEFAVLAKKRANEACYHDGETEALLLKGQCEVNTSDLKGAINTFNKAYYIQSKIKSEVGMCQARVELSKAYLMYGNTNLALQHLLHLKEMAELHNLTFYLAQAYRYLGEFYLNNGEPGKATPLLSDALDIFYKTGAIAQADQVRKLEALSSGLELMPQYIELIRQTGRECDKWFENLIKLVRWKDLREPFYEKKESGLLPEIFSHLSQKPGEETKEKQMDNILELKDETVVEEESSSQLPAPENNNVKEVETKYIAYE
ncbi:tetratricopeptide repeat protein 29-like [Rhynchophorus ferrugineus]|uniref:tetratricopeptide repeat protein 29-like n=1 Tax=Rhynchophorus ferrugineus TaxID=354439 RepID=UPI003FCD9EB4